MGRPSGIPGASTSKNLSVFWDNLAKLFDAYTLGVLTENGANAGQILRAVHKSLGTEMVEIVSDSKATEKLVDEIKRRQAELNPETVANAPVSETTKKVVTKTLDPSDCDIFQLTVDFCNELQNDIMLVK